MSNFLQEQTNFNTVTLWLYFVDACCILYSERNSWIWVPCRTQQVNYFPFLKFLWLSVSLPQHPQPWPPITLHWTTCKMPACTPGDVQKTTYEDKWYAQFLTYSAKLNPKEPNQFRFLVITWEFLSFHRSITHKIVALTFLKVLWVKNASLFNTPFLIMVWIEDSIVSVSSPFVPVIPPKVGSYHLPIFIVFWFTVTKHLCQIYQPPL